MVDTYKNSSVKRILLTVAFLFMVLLLHAQQSETQQIISDIIEDITAQAESEQDYSELTDFLQNIAESPVDINTITAEQLREMVFLNEFQIASLLDYRDSLGSIYTIYELMGVAGFATVDVKRMQPFFVFKKIDEVRPKSILNGRNQLVFRYRTQIETSRAYSDDFLGNRYLGDKNSYFSRYRYRAGKHMEIGLTAEKDPGEPCFDGTFKSGVDYLSGYVNFKNYRWLKSLIIGNFKAGFGQGLTFWSGLSFGKSGNTLGVGKNASGISPHASAFESQYLQGVGATVGFENIDATIFASYRNIDAGIADTLSSGDLSFTSLPETGYHRTVSEIDNRNSIAELVAGANMRYNIKNARMGLSFVHQKIDGFLNRDLAVYELHQRPMVKNVIGANIDATLKKHSIFCEVAFDVDSASAAVVAGGLFRISNMIQVSLLGRSYSKNFNSRYTAGFAEGNTSNENGLYAGVSMLVAMGWKLSTYIDLFQFPWMRFGVYSPSFGREFMLLSEHSLGRNMNMHFRYRFKQKAGNLSGSTSTTSPVVMQTTHNARLQLNYSPVKGVSLKTSINATASGSDSTNNEVGYLLTQDIGYNLNRIPLTLNFRFAVFDTPSWNTRIYSYESDMLYSFSVPAYYSKGSRYFVLLKYSPIPWLDVWLRYSQTFFSLMDEIGSGPDLIKGNTRSEFKAMIRLKF